MIRLWTSCLLSLALGQVVPAVPTYGQVAVSTMRAPIVSLGASTSPYVASVGASTRPYVASVGASTSPYVAPVGQAAPFVSTVRAPIGLTANPYVSSVSLGPTTPTSVGTTTSFIPTGTTSLVRAPAGPLVPPAGVNPSMYPLSAVYNPYGTTTNVLSGSEPVGPISGQPVVYGQVPGHYETQAITTQTPIPQAVSVTTAPITVPALPITTPVLTAQPIPVSYGPVSAPIPKATTSYALRPHRHRYRHGDDYDYDYDYGFDWGSSFFYYFAMGCKFAPKWCGVVPFLAGQRHHRINPVLAALFIRG